MEEWNRRKKEESQEFEIISGKIFSTQRVGEDIRERKRHRNKEKERRYKNKKRRKVNPKFPECVQV